MSPLHEVSYEDKIMNLTHAVTINAWICCHSCLPQIRCKCTLDNTCFVQNEMMHLRVEVSRLFYSNSSRDSGCTQDICCRHPSILLHICTHHCRHHHHVILSKGLLKPPFLFIYCRYFLPLFFDAAPLAALD